MHSKSVIIKRIQTQTLYLSQELPQNRAQMSAKLQSYRSVRKETLLELGMVVILIEVIAKIQEETIDDLGI